MLRSLRISHVEFRFSDSEKLGPSRNGRMERKISGISEFPEKKDNLERLTKIFEKIFRKFSVPFDFEPEFSEILVEWNAPKVNHGTKKHESAFACVHREPT